MMMMTSIPAHLTVITVGPLKASTAVPTLSCTSLYLCRSAAPSLRHWSPAVLLNHLIFKLPSCLFLPLCSCSEVDIWQNIYNIFCLKNCEKGKLFTFHYFVHHVTSNVFYFAAQVWRQFESQWYIYLPLSLWANLSPVPSSLFADCLANAGPIVVNILYMYIIRQAWSVPSLL